MSGSLESWKRGRDFELKIQRILPKYFDSIKPTYTKKTPKKRNFDFLAKENNKIITIECKSCNSDYSMNIGLSKKDLSANYLFLRLKNKLYIFKKIKERRFN